MAGALLLAGCTSAVTPSQAPETPTPGTETAPQTATPQQFASIIAGHESDWRKTIKGAADCRYLWVMGAEDAMEETEAMTCYVREATIVMTAATAAKEIRELEPSNDMASLVTDTLAELDAISAVDLEGACGEPFDDDAPNDTKKCTAAIGSLYGNYVSFKKVLDAWKPYT
jgi:hypothetical protein